MRAFIVLSGTAIAVRREWTPSATEALRLVLDHMKLRRPGVRIEDERGNPGYVFSIEAIGQIREPDKSTGGPNAGRPDRTSRQVPRKAAARLA